MRFRWTNDELKHLSDLEIVRGILSERISGLNIYAPLYKRLRGIIDKIYNGETLTSPVPVYVVNEAARPTRVRRSGKKGVKSNG